jgi:hypothetical protein
MYITFYDADQAPGRSAIAEARAQIGSYLLRSGRERAALRRSFLDGDSCSVRHHRRRPQHQAYEGDHPLVRHAIGDPGQQALMMNPVERPLDRLPTITPRQKR